MPKPAVPSRCLTTLRLGPSPPRVSQLGSLTHHIFIHKCQPVHSLSRHLGVLREDEVHLTHPAEDTSLRQALTAKPYPPPHPRSCMVLLGAWAQSFSFGLQGSHRDEHIGSPGLDILGCWPGSAFSAPSPSLRLTTLCEGRGSLVLASHVNLSFPYSGFPLYSLKAQKCPTPTLPPFTNSCFLTATRAIPAPQGRKVARPQDKKKSYQSRTTLETPHPPTLWSALFSAASGLSRGSHPSPVFPPS